MCAILDANVVAEVFNPGRAPAGEGFFNWIHMGKGRVVVGGKLHRELVERSPGFREWARTAEAAGRLRFANESEVNTRTERIKREGACESDDPHVLALAQISGARLLYTNDKDLQRDFTSKGLIDNPRGKVYSTLESNDFSPRRKRLLGNKDLCRVRL